MMICCADTHTFIISLREIFYWPSGQGQMNIAGTIRDDFSTVQIRGSCFGNEKKKGLQLQRANTTGKEEKKENKLLHRPKTVKCTVKRVTAGHLERSIDPMNTFRMIDASSQYAGSFFQNRRLELLPGCGDKSPIFSSSVY